MNAQVYKKVGRKYVPVGYSDGFTGFPSDGIWLVKTTDGSKCEECILKLSELNQNINFDIFKTLHENKNNVIEYLSKLRDNDKFHIYEKTLSDFVDELILKFSVK